MILALSTALGAASAPGYGAPIGGTVYTPNSEGCIRLVDAKTLPVAPLKAVPQPEGPRRALPPCGKLENALRGAYRLPFPWKLQPMPAFHEK
jgi:hypothetical protein